MVLASFRDQVIYNARKKSGKHKGGNNNETKNYFGDLDVTVTPSWDGDGATIRKPV